MSDEKKTEKVEHKVGEKLYASRGNKEAECIIIGAPRVKNVRWVTISLIHGGVVQSFPEEEFDKHYWVVGENA